MYQVIRKGRVIAKVKPRRLTVKLLIELTEVYGYTIRGSFESFTQLDRHNKRG